MTQALGRGGGAPRLVQLHARLYYLEARVQSPCRVAGWVGDATQPRLPALLALALAAFCRRAPVWSWPTASSCSDYAIRSWADDDAKALSRLNLRAWYSN